jgi:cupin fold WbuC family metalloprotein
MHSIFSAIDNKVICSYIKRDEILGTRTDMCHVDESLQVGVKKVQKGTKVGAHKHNKIERKTETTQESWVVIAGEINAEIYDKDDSYLSLVTLKAGDCIVFFAGGHSMESMEENTIFYEFKNGPYNGVENDKQFI